MYAFCEQQTSVKFLRWKKEKLARGDLSKRIAHAYFTKRLFGNSRVRGWIHSREGNAFDLASRTP